MYLLIDNYDSFTYILQDYFLRMTDDCVVYKNDDLSIEKINTLNPERIILSPGPCTPLQAGICMDVIHHFHQSIPILGVCLGHQAIGMYFGATLSHAAYPMHGKTSSIQYEAHPIFHQLSNPFLAMRYHSLVLTQLPESLLPLAIATDDQSIMAVAHQQYPCVGIQFHPESIGTPDGFQLLQNWKNMTF